MRPLNVDDPTATRDRTELAELALETIRHGLCVFDGNQRLLLFNRQYAEMYDIDPASMWIGMTLREVVDLRYAAGSGPDMPPADYARWRDRIGWADRGLETEVKLRNGNVHLIHHEPLPGGGWVATFEDTTERNRAEARIRHLAHHDQLTGLANRALFNERLERMIARLRGADGLEHHRPDLDRDRALMSAVILLDLDHFKDVNDTLGHAAGDVLLHQVASRVGVYVRPQDTFARLGGDEFAILVDGFADPEEAGVLAARIVGLFDQPFLLGGRDTAVRTSVGIAICRPDDGVPDPAVLLRNADMALYQAKAAGRGTYRFFEPAVGSALHRHKQLENDLRQVLATGGLEVHFQPLFGINSRRVVGAEALARWNHPQHGMVPPSEFIPLAEQAGLIEKLGAWVLQTACTRAARWAGLRLAVNLSPEQVRRPGLVALVTDVLAKTGLSPENLELEITEGVLLQDTDATLATLGRVRALGVQLALDDFGTGYSSLSYLLRFPFNRLKIDRGFVASLGSANRAASIVQGIARLGHGLDISVTAEGVETEAQWTALCALDCDEAQGYFLGRPSSAEVFERTWISIDARQGRALDRDRAATRSIDQADGKDVIGRRRARAATPGR